MKYILSVVAVAAAFIMLSEPDAIGDTVRESVSLCLEVMIPSLFAFTVLAVYLQESGLYKLVMKPLTLPLSKLMGMDEELCAVFLLSNIGGYPVGAKLLTRLVESGRLSHRDAGRMMCFCYGSGPSFIVSIVGQRIFGSYAVGGVIFAACFISSLIIGIIVNRCGERICTSSTDERYDLGSGCFITSVISASRVMFTVCTMIVCFSAIASVFEFTGIDTLAEKLFSLLGAGANASCILPALMEISRIQCIVPLSVFVLPLCGALLSFGGICVILQIKAISESCISLKPFLITRIPAMVLSGGLSLLAVPFFDITTQYEYIPTSSYVQSGVFSVNAGMSLCVLAMCAMLIAFSKTPNK